MTYIGINNYIIYKIINIYFQPITTFLFIYFKRKPIIIFQQLLLTQVAFKEQIFMPIGFTRHTVLHSLIQKKLSIWRLLLNPSRTRLALKNFWLMAAQHMFNHSFLVIHYPLLLLHYFLNDTIGLNTISNKSFEVFKALLGWRSQVPNVIRVLRQRSQKVKKYDTVPKYNFVINVTSPIVNN